MEITGSEMKKATHLRLLLLEDQEDDALLVVRELRRAGYDVAFDRVETRDQFRAALATGDRDLVIADYRLPSWTGLGALDVLREEKRDIPLILVTGLLGEETAVECIKRGAADYVLKDRLSRLPVAVRWALQQREHRLERQRAEAEREHLIEQLQAALAQVKVLSGMLPICAQCKKIRDNRGSWNHLESYIQKHSEARFSHGICPQCCRTLYPDLYAQTEEGSEPANP